MKGSVKMINTQGGVEVKRILKWIGISAGALIVLFIVIGIIAVNTGDKSPTETTAPPSVIPADAPASVPLPPPTPAPLIKPVTFEPITITGSGDKTSPPFTVTTEEWTIDWSYITDDLSYSVFSFFVYPRGETAIFIESVLFPQETSGSTYSYAGQGDYYIKVSAGNINSWEIVIKPAK